MAEYSKEPLYFLKLPKDFFQEYKMRALEGLPNGKEYELLFLKLMVESVSHNGYLRFDEARPYTAEMIAGITNTDIDTVKVGLLTLQQFGLVEITDTESIYIPKVPELTAKTTVGAEKKQMQRERSGQQADICPPREYREPRGIRELDTSTTELPKGRSSVDRSKPVQKSLKQRELCQILLDCGFIDESELQDPRWDELLDSYAHSRDYVDLKCKISYVLRTYTHYKMGEPDRTGKPTYSKQVDQMEMSVIKNKFAWFRAALEKAFEQWDDIDDDDKPF